MALLKAYLKGSTEPIEWTLDSALESDDISALLAGVDNGLTVKIRTDVGWVVIDPTAFAALDVILAVD